jgi:hypothetical protein
LDAGTLERLALVVLPQFRAQIRESGAIDEAACRVKMNLLRVAFPYWPPAPADTAGAGATDFYDEEDVTAAIDPRSSSGNNATGT